MNSCRLLPDEIVTTMVTARLSLKDVKEKGWLLDGLPRRMAFRWITTKFCPRRKFEETGDVYIMLDASRLMFTRREFGETGDVYIGERARIRLRKNGQQIRGLRRNVTRSWVL